MNVSFGPFLVIVLCGVLGFALRRSGRFSGDAPRVLNTYVINIAVPALVLAQLPGFLQKLAAGETQIDRALILLPFIPWLIFLGAIAFFGWLYRRGVLTREQWGLLVLSGGLGNTAFVGFPLLEALLGPQSLPPAILLDQFGTFLALALGGTLWLAIFKEGRRPTARKVFGDLVRFPPFLALLGAFVVAAFGGWSELAHGALERIAATLLPVALVSVGAQLRVDRRMFRAEARGLVWGLGYKMALMPLAVYGLARISGASDTALQIGVLEAAMAPMITSTVLGMEAGFAPDLGALMLGIGIPLSLVSVPLIHALLGATL